MNTTSHIPAVILVGGLGTRLRSVIGEFPKPMVDIHGKPFLQYLIEYLKVRGVKKFVLCVGYKHEIAEEYFGDGSKFGVEIAYAIEEELLGTAGAIKNAEHLLQDSEKFFVMNGDSFLKFDLNDIAQFGEEVHADFTMLLTDSGEKERSGNVVIDSEGHVTQFKEKDAMRVEGEVTYVNAGVYLMKKNILEMIPQDEKFSLEYDLVPLLLEQEKGFFGKVIAEELIDIGTPESLEYFKNNTDLFF